MGFQSSSAAGRLEALATNTGFKLRKVVEHRKIVRYRLDDDSVIEAQGEYDIHRQPGRIYIGSRGELVGECGHVVEITNGADWNAHTVGRKKRCPQCPIEPKPETPEAERCDYDWANEFGIVRRCNIRARYRTDEWGPSPEVIEAALAAGLPQPTGAKVCKKHYDHLLREGYLTHPGTKIETPKTAKGRR